MLAIRDYEQAPYLVLATRNGLVKKTRLGDYNSPRQAGVIAINFREDDDELIGAELVNADDDILLVSRKGQAIRFRADDAPAAADGPGDVRRHRHEVPHEGDSVLSMSVIRAAQVAVEDADRGRRRGGGRARCSTSSRSPTAASPSARGSASTALTNRGGLGVKAMTLTNEDRGGLVGAFIVEDGDEVLSITQNGQVVRSPINDDFRPTGRSTMGVKFVTPKAGDAVAVVARSVEAKVVDEATGEAADERRGRRDQTTATDEPTFRPDAGRGCHNRRRASASRRPTHRTPTNQMTKGRVKADDATRSADTTSPRRTPPTAAARAPADQAPPTGPPEDTAAAASRPTRDPAPSRARRPRPPPRRPRTANAEHGARPPRSPRRSRGARAGREAPRAAVRAGPGCG